MHRMRTSALFTSLGFFAAAAPASATFAGRDGALTIAAPNAVGSTLRSADPRARIADCLGIPSVIWRLESGHLSEVGGGEQTAFSPTGRQLAVYDPGDPCHGYGGGPPDPNAGVYLELADGSRRRRLPGDTLVGWSGNHLLVAKRSTDRVQVLDALNGARVMTLPAATGQLAVSCSGRIAAGAGGASPWLELFQRQRFGRGSRSQVLRTGVRVSSGHPISNLAWSPDGQTLLYERSGTTNRAIWLVNADGSHAHLLRPPSEDTEFGAWAPDGKQVAYYEFGTTQTAALLVANANGSSPRILVRHADYPHPPQPGEQRSLGPVWSPDSLSIAIQATTTFGSDSAAVLDASTGAREQLISFTRYPLDASFSVEPADWQAAGGSTTACADRGPAPVP
jgi:WD40 repeat protein